MSARAAVVLSLVYLAGDFFRAKRGEDHVLRVHAMNDGTWTGHMAGGEWLTFGGEAAALAWAVTTLAAMGADPRDLRRAVGLPGDATAA